MTLKDRNRIFGTPLSVDELLDPLEEYENLDTEAETFNNNDAIIMEVHRQEVVQNGEAIDVDSDDGNDEDHEPEEAKPATVSELIALAEKLEVGYVSQVGADSSPDFLHHIHAFQAELRRNQMKNAKQTTLASHGFFIS